jgi:hypothetical protein
VRYHVAVELGAGKIAMVLVAVLTVAGLGGWAWASATMEGRLAAVRNESRAIGYARGGRLPTDREVRDRVDAIAAQHRVTLTGLEVTSHEEEGLGRVAARVPGIGQTLAGRLRVYDVRASATARELVFSLTEPLEVALELRAAVGMRSGSGAHPAIEAPGASTDVHGGLRPEDYEQGSQRGL